MRTTPKRESQLPSRATTSATAPQDTNVKRRRFLLALGAGPAAAAAAATSLAAPVGSVTQQAATTAAGYRETEHVRDYYASTRI
ncbi:MAG TPA: formate dehydrogenase [Casimicrobiaceae bacterium]|nr:formate dehydrogenase [Casimicrobiaceae bacterium]